jgi:hypothetical protein
VKGLRRAAFGAFATVLGCADHAGLLRSTAASPGLDEQFCAWFGDVRDGVLYFGESAFWSEFRARGEDPLADLALQGPKRIGRFDLVHEKMLAPLEVAAYGPTGTWDVLAHPNGRIYFTSFFEPPGWVSPASGAVRTLPALGKGLNELTLGQDGSIFATRYGGSVLGQGAVVQFDPEGRLLAEFPLPAPPGYIAAAKSVAWDRLRRQIWVNTDLIPGHAGPIRYDARLLDEQGEELLRYEMPALYFMSFGPDGTGYFAEVSERLLELRIVAPNEASTEPGFGRSITPDTKFPYGYDAVQDVRAAADGRVVVTRWGGTIHVVGPGDDVTTFQLPAPPAHGLYYTGELTGNRVCVTLCADLSVVCDSLP